AIEHGADARVDGVAQALHERGITQRKPAAVGRIGSLDRSHHEAGGADALKIHVAAEIVAARPLRRQRRLQPRLQLDKAAHRRRSPLRTRSSFVWLRGLSIETTRSTKRSVRSRMSRVSTKPVS